jgi:hypothetical protein
MVVADWDVRVCDLLSETDAAYIAAASPDVVAALVEGLRAHRDRAAALEARAELAEARLAALWTMDPDRWTSGLYLQVFGSINVLADALRAQALGCTVDELPERKATP